MSEWVLPCAVIADFNASNLGGYLRSDQAEPRIEPLLAPFGPMEAVLTDQHWDGWKAQPRVAIVWTRPEAVSGTFTRALAHEDVAPEMALADVDVFADRLELLSTRVEQTLLPMWFMTQPARRLGVLAMKDGQPGNMLLRMNARLVERVSAMPSVQLLDGQRWLMAAGRRAFDPKLWYWAKIPFAHEVFREAALDFKAAFRAARGAGRKLLVLDLDDTLWGGVVGEEGWDGIRLGGHDHIGEAHTDFQRALKALTAHGVLLGIVSKNEERVALDAIANHPEMVLTRNDFAGWRINWEDKARNIVELAAELNLGLNSVVFIDDNPVERARVRETLPDVYVPEWPASCLSYTTALWSLDCFETLTITAEDRTRSRFYVLDTQRNRERQAVGSIEEWLKSLGQTVSVSELTAVDLPRAAQLLNKTNQMNLSVRRLTAHELETWASSPHRKVWTIRVSDKFGDAGITGVLSVEVARPSAQVVDFVMSCRVMGRQVEETMLHVAARYAREAGVERMRLDYVATPRNAPFLKFLRKSGLREETAETFSWTPDLSCRLPDGVALAEQVASR